MKIIPSLFVSDNSETEIEKVPLTGKNSYSLEQHEETSTSQGGRYSLTAIFYSLFNKKDTDTIENEKVRINAKFARKRLSSDSYVYENLEKDVSLLLLCPNTKKKYLLAARCFLDGFISYLEKIHKDRQKVTDLEGIFRVPASQTQVNVAFRKFITQKNFSAFSIETPDSIFIASLMKKIFNRLTNNDIDVYMAQKIYYIFLMIYECMQDAHFPKTSKMSIESLKRSAPIIFSLMNDSQQKALYTHEAGKHEIIL